MSKPVSTEMQTVRMSNAYHTSDTGMVVRKALTSESPWPMRDGTSRVVYMIDGSDTMYLNFEDALQEVR